MTSISQAHDRGGHEITRQDGQWGHVLPFPSSPAHAAGLPNDDPAAIYLASAPARREGGHAIRPPCSIRATRSPNGPSRSAPSKWRSRCSPPTLACATLPAEGAWLEPAWIGLLRPAFPEHRMQWRCRRWSAREHDRVRFMGWRAGGDGAAGIDLPIPRGPKPKRGLHGPRFRIQSFKCDHRTPDVRSRTIGALPRSLPRKKCGT